MLNTSLDSLFNSYKKNIFIIFLLCLLSYLTNTIFAQSGRGNIYLVPTTSPIAREVQPQRIIREVFGNPVANTLGALIQQERPNALRLNELIQHLANLGGDNEDFRRFRRLTNRLTEDRLNDLWTSLASNEELDGCSITGLNGLIGDYFQKNRLVRFRRVTFQLPPSTPPIQRYKSTGNSTRRDKQSNSGCCSGGCALM